MANSFNKLPTPSPTGRLSVSEPEMQYLPGDTRAWKPRTGNTRSMSMSGPCLQQIPKSLTPPKLFVDMDFSALELRTLAFALSTS